MVSTLGADGSWVEVAVELRPGLENVALLELPKGGLSCSDWEVW